MNAAKLIILIIFTMASCTNYVHVPDFMRDNSIKWKKSDKVYILFRHAEKMEGKDPHLKEEGKKRAEILAEMWDGKKVKEVFSTDYNRTKETIAPLLESINQEFTLYNPRKLGDFSEMLKSKSAGVYVISGHSNTTPTLANKLCNCSEYPKIDESDYSNIFVIVSNDKRNKVYKLTY